jgi:hypothetical protein
MRKALATMAVLTAIATPALAQSYDPDVGSGNIVPGPSQGVVRRAPYSDALGFARRTVPQRSIGVYDSRGQLIGADPDPNVRMELRNDHVSDE